ncbi:MAG: magnesium transporter [bacterium]|nr:magnesium transporter [bacterium]
MSSSTADIYIRDNEGALLASFVKSVRSAIEDANFDNVRLLSQGLHDSDLADLIEHLSTNERFAFVEAIGSQLNPATLVEVEEAVRDELVVQLPNEQIAEAVEELDTDDAVYLLEDLDVGERQKILDQVPHDVRSAVVRGLQYPDDSAGRRMRQNFVHVPTFWTVEQTIDHLRDASNLPDHFSEVFVTTPSLHLKGTVSLDDLLRSSLDTAIKELMDDERHLINVELDQEELARQFERYNLLSAPVVDDDSRLVGVVTVDDIVEVMAEEAQEDIFLLAGVGDESLADTVLRTALGRFSWLFINLITALIASYVISLFDATIEQMVALAVLMPIVASMGGNAGTQTMTVTVRALATRDLGAANAGRVITRETLVGLLNGIAFAILMALVAYFWFGSSRLSGVLAAAMIVNMFVAGISGILIPLVLEYRKVDPALASSVFVTTVTDIVGFFAFLGLAAIYLI